MKLQKLASTAISGISACLALTFIYANGVMADAISPHINDDAGEYSNEAPNTTFFGTGMSGRMNEASTLRFTGDQDLSDAKYDDAIRKLSKAVQLDPGDPEGHMLYARAMTAKILKTKKQPVDQELLKKCAAEWKMLSRHDADMLNQYEANSNLRRLNRIAKAMKKAEKLALKQHDAQTESGTVAQRPGAIGTQ